MKPVKNSLGKDEILNQLIQFTTESLLEAYYSLRIRRCSIENANYHLRLKVNKKSFGLNKIKNILVVEALELNNIYQKKGIYTEYFKKLPSLIDGEKIIGVEAESVLHDYLERTLKKLGYRNEPWRADCFFKEALRIHDF